MAAARSRFDPLKPERSEPRPDQPAGDVVKGGGRQPADPDSDELVDLASATAARQVFEPDDILSVVPRPIKRVAEDDTDVVPAVAARLDDAPPYLVVSGHEPVQQTDASTPYLAAPKPEAPAAVEVEMPDRSGDSLIHYDIAYGLSAEPADMGTDALLEDGGGLGFDG